MAKEKTDPKLLEMLVCPLTQSPLRYDARKKQLVSEKAGLAFPILNGVPIMLDSEAEEVK